VARRSKKDREQVELEIAQYTKKMLAVQKSIYKDRKEGIVGKGYSNLPAPYETYTDPDGMTTGRWDLSLRNQRGGKELSISHHVYQSMQHRTYRVLITVSEESLHTSPEVVFDRLHKILDVEVSVGRMTHEEAMHFYRKVKSEFMAITWNGYNSNYSTTTEYKIGTWLASTSGGSITTTGYAPPQPKKDDSPLGWLREQVQELCAEGRKELAVR
jgi:hypothetical protein